MSKNLSVQAVKLFDAEVKAAYQASGASLMSVIRKKTVRAQKYQFPKMGSGMAKPRQGPSSEVVPMSLGHSNVECTVSEWEAFDYIDIFQQSETNVEERAPTANAIAMAIKRREDQLVIAALNASGQSDVVGVSVGGANTAMNVTKLRKAGGKLDRRNVPATDRYFLAHTDEKEALLGETQTTSSDYAAVKALVSGTLTQFYGFNFIWLGEIGEGGLTVAANARSNFAFHGGMMGSMGGVSVLDDEISTDWVPQRQSWLVGKKLIAGAVCIDNPGVVPVETYVA
jgi:hypothetical protein